MSSDISKRISSQEKPTIREDDPEKVIEGSVEDFEVFKQTTDGVNFRTVGWPRASVIFLKVSILSTKELEVLFDKV